MTAVLGYVVVERGPDDPPLALYGPEVRSWRAPMSQEQAEKIITEQQKHADNASPEGVSRMRYLLHAIVPATDLDALHAKVAEQEATIERLRNPDVARRTSCFASGINDDLDRLIAWGEPKP